MLWVSLSLLASSALVVQLRLLMATAVVLYRTTVYVIMCVVHGQVFAVTMNSTTKVQNPRQNSA